MVASMEKCCSRKKKNFTEAIAINICLNIDLQLVVCLSGNYFFNSKTNMIKLSKTSIKIITVQVTLGSFWKLKRELIWNLRNFIDLSFCC